jgi:hypothetical protein
LAWRYGTYAEPSILLAVPPYASSLEEALPPPWSVYLDHVRRLALAMSPAVGPAYAERHGLGSARRSLRDELGAPLFAALAARLGDWYGLPVPEDRLATFDPVGIDVVLTAMDRGYRGPDDEVGARLAGWAEVHGRPLLALLDDDAAMELLESWPNDAALHAVRESLAHPERVAAARAAWTAADEEAMAAACLDAEHPGPWDDEARRAIRALVDALVAPTAEAMRAEPTLVALDACFVVGADGALARLRTAGLELVALHEAD